MTVLSRKWVSIVTVLVCFPIVMLTAGHGMAQPPVTGAGKAPGHALYGAKVPTFTPKHYKVVTTPVRTNVPVHKSTAGMSGNSTAKMIGTLLEKIIGQRTGR